MGQGEVGGCTALADSAWQLLQLAIEKAWSVLAWFPATHGKNCYSIAMA